MWTYAPDTGKFVDIFDFRRKSNGDFRDSRIEHDIKLLGINDSGDLDFMVYGYMNAEHMKDIVALESTIMTMIRML